MLKYIFSKHENPITFIYKITEQQQMVENKIKSCRTTYRLFFVILQSDKVLINNYLKTKKLMKHVYTSIFTLALLAISSNSFAQGPNNSGTYYQAADGKKGEALKTALCAIIYNRTERTYKQLWTDFYTTDAKSNGKVWDMYSNKREMTFGTDQAGSYSKEGDVYNREHSWPNSWFGGEKQPMYTDLHHLYPTDGYVNNKRSNYAFGETNGSWKSANDFSKLGTCTYPGYSGTVFEPNDDYKGDFARTYFYMVTCYEEKIADWYINYGVNNTDPNKAETRNAVMATLDGNAYPGLQKWQREMLMKWSKNDPVDSPVAKETPRNNAVAEIQKNRNPFIDYPGLEEYIWGSLKEVPFSYDNYQNPTAIMTIKAEPTYKEGVIYNLSGQVVDKSYKGIVIINGKKIIQK